MPFLFQIPATSLDQLHVIGGPCWAGDRGDVDTFPDLSGFAHLRMRVNKSCYSPGLSVLL